MDPAEIAALRTMYVFVPAEGESWGLTFEGLASALRERTRGEFVREADGPPRPSPGASTMAFGFTLAGEALEGTAKQEPEGAAISDCDAPAAAAFALWLRQALVPAGAAITFNTAWGLEEDLPDTLLPEDSRDAVIAAFVYLVAATGNLD